MKRIIIFVFILLPFTVAAQQHIHKNKRLFFPHIVLNYNLHNIDYDDFQNNQAVQRKSHFAGAEFGFTKIPKSKYGYYFQYNNKLLPELAIRELYKLFDLSAGERIKDYTLSTGFFGIFDAGKRFSFSKDSEFTAGFRLSDQYLSGVSEIPVNSESYYDGFHITPGIFALYKRNINRYNYLSAKIAFTHSIVNYWQFEEQSDELNFVLPLFTDLTVDFYTKFKFFLKTGFNIMFPHEQISPLYRISFGAGYRF